MKILVTGGSGFIGSHTMIELLENGNEVICVDDFSNSNQMVNINVEKITGKSFRFYQGNVLDKELLRKIFVENEIDIVIHFAGYKAVGESVKDPLKYYHNNLISTIYLCEVMKEFGCKKLVFSSSATVYAPTKKLPIAEDADLQTSSPYGTTKLMVENILKDLGNSDPEWSIALLRYFNPIGAHPSGLIGENPNGVPNNLMPYIVKVANNELPVLHVFGNDYETRDGTGVRDYIHVVDLAKGHVLACNYVMKEKGVDSYNIGTGKGCSVLELVSAFSKVNGVDIPYQIDPRREGDIDAYYGDPSYANQKLGFEATKTIEDMCRDSYLYAKNHSKNI